MHLSKVNGAFPNSDLEKLAGLLSGIDANEGIRVAALLYEPEPKVLETPYAPALTDEEIATRDARAREARAFWEAVGRAGGLADPKNRPAIAGQNLVNLTGLLIVLTSGEVTQMSVRPRPEWRFVLSVDESDP